MQIVYIVFYKTGFWESTSIKKESVKALDYFGSPTPKTSAVSWCRG